MKRGPFTKLVTASAAAALALGAVACEVEDDGTLDNGGVEDLEDDLEE